MDISHILLLIIIGIILFYILNSVQVSNFEQFDINNGVDSREMISGPRRVAEKITVCPLEENDFQTKNYIAKNLLSVNPVRCDIPTQTISEFNKDFFKFRDYTFQSSSMSEDPVDKIQSLYLNGDLGVAPTYNGVKIRDIYDTIACGSADVYQRHCVRVPKLDNTMNPGYNFSFLTGLYGTRDEWSYPDDRVENGGEIATGLYAHDKQEIHQMPLNNMLGFN